MNEDIKQKIADEVESKHPFVWPLNKHGEPMEQLVGHSSPPFFRKHTKQNEHRIKWAEYGYSLAEQEITRLKELIKDAYDAGYKRGEHNGNNYGNAFDYLLADKTTPTWQQFKTNNQL